MTWKDYETVAACLGGAWARHGADEPTLMDVRERLMLEFELDNPRFKRVRFEEAVAEWQVKHGGG